MQLCSQQNNCRGGPPTSSVDSDGVEHGRSESRKQGKLKILMAWTFGAEIQGKINPVITGRHMIELWLHMRPASRTIGTYRVSNVERITSSHASSTPSDVLAL